MTDVCGGWGSEVFVTDVCGGWGGGEVFMMDACGGWGRNGFVTEDSSKYFIFPHAPYTLGAHYKGI